MAVKPIPDGFHTVTPQLNVQGAAKVIDFMKAAFDAQEMFRMPGPGGAIMHAQVRVGDSIVMLSEAVRQDPMPGNIFLYVRDTDATYKQAVKAGGSTLMEPTNMFWGDRFASVRDPGGNIWGIATHIEDVPPEEMPKRAAAAANR
jgi:PhnB protein